MLSARRAHECGRQFVAKILPAAGYLPAPVDGSAASGRLRPRIWANSPTDRSSIASNRIAKGSVQPGIRPGALMGPGVAAPPRFRFLAHHPQTTCIIAIAHLYPVCYPCGSPVSRPCRWRCGARCTATARRRSSSGRRGGPTSGRGPPGPCFRHPPPRPRRPPPRLAS